MRIINKHTGETVYTIMTNHSMSLDEAIRLAGEIHPENEDENVEIGGSWYFYDDLDITYEDETVVKYEILKDSVEIKRRYGRRLYSLTTADIIDEYDSGDTAGRYIGSFTNEADARAEFEARKRECSTGLYRGTTGWLIEADVLVLQKNVYDVDEDGDEWLDQGEDLDSYAEPFTSPEDKEEEE